MKNILIRILLVISAVALIILISVYNINLNNSIKVLTQEIKIKDLPQEFEGFTILQISDLHSKVFGENQKELIDIVNSQKYDIIAISGDMQNDGDIKPFITLLEGIKNKEEVFYTPGNHGPYYYENYTGYYNFIDTKERERALTKNKGLSKDGEALRELGIKFLDMPHEIVRDGKQLWVSELLYNDELNYLTNNDYEKGDVKIAITHYPMDNWVYQDYGGMLADYALVIAGHYHGGQWRIPGIGAFFVPKLNGNGWFPSQESVSGLTEWHGFKQYVSRGLGSAGPYNLLRFRLFNSPEINLIKLIKE